MGPFGSTFIGSSLFEPAQLYRMFHTCLVHRPYNICGLTIAVQGSSLLIHVILGPAHWVDVRFKFLWSVCNSGSRQKAFGPEESNRRVIHRTVQLARSRRPAAAREEAQVT